MKVRLGILEANAQKPYTKWDYTYLIEMPAVPRIGERIDVWRTDMKGKRILDLEHPTGGRLEQYLVEDIAWQIELPDNGNDYSIASEDPIGKMAEVTVWVSLIP